MNEPRPSALDRIRAEETELYGVDFVRGLTDRPERVEPIPRRDRTIPAAPFGWSPPASS